MIKSKLQILFLSIVFVCCCEQAHAACYWDAWLWTCDGFGQTLGSVTMDPPPMSQETQERSENKPFKCGDPVFLSNGQFSYECNDLTIPGRQLDVDIEHAYFSGLALNGAFGYGWNLNYHVMLHELTTNDVTIVTGDGRKTQYTFTAGNYTTPAGRFEKLVKNANGTFTLTMADGKKHNFNANGTLASIADRNGNQLTFTYNPAGLIPIIGISSFTQTPGEHVVIGYDYQLTKIADTVGREINFSYNANGRLLTITDYAGRVVRFTYDPNTDDLLTITKPATTQYPNGLPKTFIYDTNHRVISIADAKGQTFVTNHYDAQGRVYQQDLGTGHFTFDFSVANQTTVTDRNGHVTTYSFDSLGNMVKQELFTSGIHAGDPTSFVTTSTYNADMLITSQTFPKGNGIKYTYDSANSDVKKHGNILQVRRKSSMAAADNNDIDIVINMTYDTQFNQIKTFTDPKSNITTYTYDYELPTNNPHYGTKGSLVYIDAPFVIGGSPRVELTSNAYGQVTEIKSPTTDITQYEYLAATGYLNKIKRDPAGINAITQLTYDNFGYLDQVTDPNNHATDYNFNELGWLLQEKNPKNYLTKYTHDENGNVTKVERQANSGATQWQKVETTYDILNHPKTIKDPLNRITTYNYDNNENISSIVDAESHTTTYEYDERNKLFKVTDANNVPGVTQYDYDINGNLAKITDANAHATNYTYDLFDRKASETFADGKVYSYAYDKNSNLTDLTKPSTAPAVTINYAYDALNRLTAKTYPSHPLLNATYAYDLSSRLVDANVTGASNHFVYDPLNRLQTNTQTIASLIYNLGYEYDKAGNRTKVIYPSSKSIVYKYDVNDNIDLVNNGLLPLVDYTYDTLDRRTVKSFPSTVPAPAQVMKNLYQYDMANQLIDLKNNAVASTLIAQYAYPTYDNVGNRTQMQTSGVPGTQTINYAYNNIYELTGVSGSQTHSYSYDKVANRLTADGITYTPNTVNQYTQVGPTTYTYDLNGNLTYDGRNTYSYDEENRLASLTGTNVSAQYTYDAFNRRIAKTINGTTTYFISDGDREVEERTVSGALSADYTYGDSIDEVLTMTRGGTTYFYHYDGLGSVTELTNVSGTTVIENYTYDPYGTPSVITSSIGNPFRYTGRRFDEESGNYYYRRRYYDPHIGRFLSRDPIGYADSLNAYSYTRNNPINYIDPNGLLTIPGIGWVDVGEGSGQSALDYWANQASQADNPLAGGFYNLMGGFAALWTPCSSNSTAGVLGGGTLRARLLGGFSKYIGQGSNPNGGYLTRGINPPYGRNFDLAQDKLQLPNKPYDVRPVRVPWWEYVVGPRPATGNPQFGKGGGDEYFRGNKFPYK